MNYWPQYIVAGEQGLIKAVSLYMVYNESRESQIGFLMQLDLLLESVWWISFRPFDLR